MKCPVIFKIVQVSSRLRRTGFPGWNKEKKTERNLLKDEGYWDRTDAEILFVLLVFTT